VSVVDRRPSKCPTVEHCRVEHRRPSLVVDCCRLSSVVSHWSWLLLLWSSSWLIIARLENEASAGAIYGAHTCGGVVRKRNITKSTMYEDRREKKATHLLLLWCWSHVVWMSLTTAVRRCISSPHRSGVISVGLALDVVGICRHLSSSVSWPSSVVICPSIVKCLRPLSIVVCPSVVVCPSSSIHHWSVVVYPSLVRCRLSIVCPLSSVHCLSIVVCPLSVHCQSVDHPSTIIDCLLLCVHRLSDRRPSDC